MFLKKRKSVIVAGCGRLGACLAGSLSEQGNSVIVIDKDKDSFRRLPLNFSGFELEGDATDYKILLSAGISQVDILVAATDDDNVNCMIAQIGSRVCGIEKVFTRLHDTSKEKILDGYNIKAIYPAKLSIEEFQRLSGIQLAEV